MTEHDYIVQQHAHIENIARKLGEEWDTVQIFVTRHEPGTMDGTISIDFGCGCMYSRLGFVKDWIIKQDERTRLEASE